MKNVTVNVQGSPMALGEPLDCIINGKKYPQDTVALYEFLLGVLWTPPESIVVNCMELSNVTELLKLLKQVRKGMAELAERDITLALYILNNKPRINCDVPNEYKNDPHFRGMVEMVKQSLRFVVG